MDLHGCPIPHTHDRLTEAYYFACRAADEYHMPLTFRFNINACLTALRSITDYLPLEGPKIEGFEGWWPSEFEQLKADVVIKKVKEARDFLVHTETLEPRSIAGIGLFRHRKFRLGLKGEVDPFEPSRSILDRAVREMTGAFVDADHVAIGEQLGVQRTWIVDQLGDAEVVEIVFRAVMRLEQTIIEVHRMAGDEAVNPVIKAPSPETYQVMLESDVDPMLPVKWGW